MSYWKSFGVALFVAVCLLGEATGSAQAQTATEWSGGKVTTLEGGSVAYGINDKGQAVGAGSFGATEWSGGEVITLGGLPASTRSVAQSINGAGLAVGYSEYDNNIGNPAVLYATEWSGSSIIDLAGLPGSTTSNAYSINSTGQAVGYSLANGTHAIEWNGGKVIDLSRDS
jgi:uncharacterized membrane protein